MNGTTQTDTDPHSLGPEGDFPLVALKAIYALIGIGGFLGNGLVCVVLRTQKRSFRSVTNLLILNQSVLDLFSTAIFLLLRLPPAIDRLPDTLLGELVCRLWVSEYCMWSLIIASTVNLVLVSLERYFATCFPVRHRFHFTARKAKAGMAFSWLWGFTYQLYWLIIRDFRGGVCDVSWSSPTLQMVMGVVFFVLEYLLPLSIMTLAYTSIILLLRRRRRLGGIVVCNVFQRAKRNVTVTLCLVFIFYVLCWTPTSVTYLLYNLGFPYDFNSTMHMVVTVIVILNACVNPIIYTLKYEQFQRQLKIIFCSRSCKRNRVGALSADDDARPRNQLRNISQHVPN
ncbi:galanin receptor type 2-like [Acanthaster planci]|uniref:Galanin receptor type 2-like n=1 Tax=Acanthaster planci TaxID=133434 RepID=A0A8B7ZUZ9_ACAPL|nr:galanin receptor type 2-like [Acanthaster planci]